MNDFFRAWDRIALIGGSDPGMVFTVRRGQGTGPQGTLKWKRRGSTEPRKMIGPEEKNKARIATEVFDLLSLMEELLPFIFLKTYECLPSSFWNDHKHLILSLLAHVGSSLDSAESSQSCGSAPSLLGNAGQMITGTSVSSLVKRCIMSL